MDVRRRLAAIERHLVGDTVTLTMIDGSEVKLSGGRGDWMPKLFCASLGSATPTSEQARQLDLIKLSVSSFEPSGLMVELLRALLNGPIEGPTSPVTGALEQKQ